MTSSAAYLLQRGVEQSMQLSMSTYLSKNCLKDIFKTNVDLFLEELLKSNGESANLQVDHIWIYKDGGQNGQDWHKEWVLPLNKGSLNVLTTSSYTLPQTTLPS